MVKHVRAELKAKGFDYNKVGGQTGCVSAAMTVAAVGVNDRLITMWVR